MTSEKTTAPSREHGHARPEGNGSAVHPREIASEEMYRTMVEAVPYGIVVVDQKGEIIQVNRWVESAFRYEPGELTGRRLELLFPKLSAGGGTALGDLPRSGEESQPRAERRETLGRGKDSAEIPVEIGLSAIDGPRGALVVVSVLDISERKLFEEQLRRSVEDLAAQKNLGERHVDELRAVNQELEDFAYAASHDLKEPLRNLMSYAQLLREDLPGDLPEEADQDLKFICSAADRMQRLVGDLLSFSRAGKGALQKEELALEDCVRESLEALGKRLGEKEVSLTQDPLPTVSGDRRLLTQVYQNLLGNAVKFHRPGVAPSIHITVEEREEEWLLGVRDNGIGVPQEHASEIFAPFKRLHGTAEFEGTGVGLAICRKAVERHGGRIWVESVPGHGSNFLFTLPRTEP